VGQGVAMTYDVAALRARFPALKDGTAYFDGPGGTQVPDVVAEAVARTLTGGISNRGQVTAAERAADDVVLGFRAAAADLVGADPGAVVYGRSATALTYDLARTLARGWAPGDEVVVTRLDHDANIRPWLQAAERVGAVVRWADFDPATGELPLAAVADQLSDRTRLIAVTGASNLLGTRPDVRAVAEVAHAVGALVHVDGVHLTAHAPVDVHTLGCDTYVWSPYKLLGPHCGVLVGRRELLEELRPDKLLPSSDAVPERFELGTLPYELMAGVTAAVDLVAGLAGDPPDDPAGRRERLLTAMAAVEAHEDRLRERVEAGLADLPGITVHSRAAHRTPTLLLTLAGRPAADAYRALAAVGVNAPAGSFYAVEASRHLGLGDAGGLRVGLSPYSTQEDVDRLLEALASFVARGNPATIGA
jgi:cysteine desulfurase family protein (TIGR01976 family)